MYCSLDPDISKRYREALEQTCFLTLADIDMIKDAELRATVLDNSIFCTQLEPASARALMPCIDEPAFKAKFTLSVNLS